MVEISTTLILGLYATFALLGTITLTRLARAFYTHYSARTALSRMKAERRASERLQISRIMVSCAKELN
jgi:hypothetical protein